mgnify:CR=1 FL=1
MQKKPKIGKIHENAMNDTQRMNLSRGWPMDFALD